MMRDHPYRFLTVVYGITVACFSVLPIVNCLWGGGNKDYSHWYEAGLLVLQGADLYTKDGGGHLVYMYPPTTAVLLAPLSALGALAVVIPLLLINSAAWLASVVLSVYLTTGRAWGQRPMLYFVPAAITAPYVGEMFFLGQPNLMLLTCMLGAFACLRRGHGWGAGALIAFAASIKAFPIAAIVYLVYRGYWKATMATLACLFFFLVLLPAPFRGFQRNLDELWTWTEGMVLRYDDGVVGQRPDRGYSWKNQSLLAVANRLLRPANANDDHNDPFWINVAELDFKAVNAVIVIVSLGLCLFYLAAMPRQAYRTDRSDAIEHAMLLLLILMFSPLSYIYFFVWLLYPLTVALNLCLSAPAPSARRTAAWTCLGGTLLLLALTLLDFALPREVVQALGNHLWACLLLLGWFGWELRQTEPTLPS